MLFYKCKVNINEFINHGNFEEIKNIFLPETFMVASDTSKECIYRKRNKGKEEQHLFTDVEKISENIIIGVYRKLGDANITAYKETEEKFKVENVQKVRCVFVYFIKEEYLYLEKTKESKKYLRQIAKNLADYLVFLNDKVYDKIGRLEIIPVPNVSTFQEELKKRKNIQSIEIKFVAPNKRQMDYHDMMEETANLPDLHSGVFEMRTKKYWDGEKLLEENKLIQSAIEYVSKGYGVVTIDKQKRGKNPTMKKLSTESKPSEQTLVDIMRNRKDLIKKIENLRE